MTRPTIETDEASLQCCVEGCRRRWANDFGYGRLCTIHDDARRERRREERAQGTLPDLPPVARHWQEEDEHDALPF